jgi:hypothetical protein
MANNPVNLTLRFVLELAALAALGYWGWTQHSGAARVLLAVGAPLIAAAAWGTFRAAGHHGPTPVLVPGMVRLALEAAYFGAATWALYASQRPGLGLAFGILVLLHYAASYDYVARLVRG